MAITSRTNGELTDSPTTMVTNIDPNSRLVKTIVVTNLDDITHILHLEIGFTIIKIQLESGNSLHMSETHALGNNDLSGYVEEAISSANLAFSCTYLDENETV
jgi:hypothetical protein